MLTDLLENLRLVFVVSGLGLTAAAGLLLWRVRGILNWKRSLRQTLAEMHRQKAAADGPREQALGHVVEACDGIWHSPSPGLDQVRALPEYVRRVAGAYFPEEARPELCLSIGQLLTAAQQLTDHLAAIVERPAFRRLGRLRIRRLRQIFKWYQGLCDNPVFAWVMARRSMVTRMLHIVRIVLPDPLAWLAYLSRRLTLIMAGRCLLLDLYLFIGQATIDAFETGEGQEGPETTSQTDETVLAAYETLIAKEETVANPELETIRDSLVGLPARLWHPPGGSEWRTAVQGAAGVIAAAHFPDSAAPLEEARFHVLLDRGRAWLTTMADCRRLAVIRPLYRVSLKRLFQVKAVAEADFMQRTGQAARGAYAAWRWGRWPFKVARWIRRRSPAGLAGEMAFSLACKAAANYLARVGFDRACRELEMVYRVSLEKPAQVMKNQKRDDS